MVKSLLSRIFAGKPATPMVPIVSTTDNSEAEIPTKHDIVPVDQEDVAKDDLDQLKIDALTIAEEPEKAFSFSPSHYLRINDDVRAAGLDAQKHYLEYGADEGRTPNSSFSSPYIFNQLRQLPMTTHSVVAHYQKSEIPQRMRIIFVSHDASRTGAPAIILRLIEMFSKLTDVECITILDEGGDRLDEFRYVSHVHVMKNQRYRPGATEEVTRGELSALFGPDGAFASNPPVVALVNSAESHRIAAMLHEFSIPIVTLLHEFATYYQKSVFQKFQEISNKVILPSQFIKKLSMDFAELDPSNLIVRGQGLLVDKFGSLDAKSCRRQLLRNLDLPEDAFIVLNVGTMDQRKGIDHFVYSAKLFLDRYPDKKEVFFVWYGSGDQTNGSAYKFALSEIERHGLKDRMRLMPPTSLIEPIFVGADLFFLSARADPFPCVIHEAMACALPVIAFKNGGGAPELIGDDCGTIVGLGDISAVVEAIHAYIDDETLFDAHSKNAVAKIARDWRYEDYFDFVRETLGKTAGVVIARKEPEFALDGGHLVVMPGGKTDWDVLLRIRKDHRIGDVKACFAFGRFSEDIEEVVAAALEDGIPFFIGQPEFDNSKGFAKMVQWQIKDCRPDELTIIDVHDYLDFDAIEVMQVKKRLVLSATSVDVDKIYDIGIYFDDIWTFDPTLKGKMLTLNPLIAGKITFLTEDQIDKKTKRKSKATVETN